MSERCPVVDHPAVDWLGWISAEREAAERRTGSTGVTAEGLDVLLDDARYCRALRVWQRQEVARKALAAAEREAREMGADRAAT